MTVLRLYTFVLLVFPSDISIKRAGAAAYPIFVASMALFVWWLASALIGQYDLRLSPNPIRINFLVLWTSTLVAYSATTLEPSESLQVNAADRWIMQLAGWTGVGLAASGSLGSRADFHSLLRALARGDQC